MMCIYALFCALLGVLVGCIVTGLKGSFFIGSAMAWPSALIAFMIGMYALWIQEEPEDGRE